MCARSLSRYHRTFPLSDAIHATAPTRDLTLWFSGFSRTDFHGVQTAARRCTGLGQGPVAWPEAEIGLRPPLLPQALVCCARRDPLVMTAPTAAKKL